LYSIAGKHVLDLGRAIRVERRSGMIPVGGVLNRLANQRGILLGDAAGAVSPLTAGGLDPCMRLSRFAARVVEAYLQSNDPQHLTGFSGAAFRGHFQKRLWMRAAIKHVTRPGLLELGCALMRIPPMKSMAWNVFFGRGSFPEATTVKQELRSELGIAEP
jgi:flavin-dependent dehydrogenase